MSSMLKKAALGALAALTLGLSIAESTPASAGGWRGGGWHGGGWHGGGWGGRGGYWRGGGWRGGYWGGGWGWGAPVAAGVIGGLALGAVAASAANPYYGYGPYSYGGCYPQRQPAYDAWGRFLGYQTVRVCY